MRRATPRPRADLRPTCDNDNPGVLQTLDKPLGDDLGHDLVRVVDPPATVDGRNSDPGVR